MSFKRNHLFIGSLTLFACLNIGLSSFALFQSRQQTKFGFVKYVPIMYILQERILETVMELLEAEKMQLDEKREELKNMKDELNESSPDMSKSKIQKQKSLITRKEKKLEALEKDYRKKLGEKFNEIFDEEHSKLVQVITDLTKQEGYDCIFYHHKEMRNPRAPELMDFEIDKAKNDLSQAVIKKMALSMDKFNEMVRQLEYNDNKKSK